MCEKNSSEEFIQFSENISIFCSAANTNAQKEKEISLNMFFRISLYTKSCMCKHHTL